jgi:hypothetical protein
MKDLNGFDRIESGAWVAEDGISCLVEPFWGDVVMTLAQDLHPDPLVGKGLVLGCDDMGESISTTLTIDDLKSMIQFWSIFEVHEHMSRSAA